MIFALISPTFSVRRISFGTLPSRICCRISGTHFGQRESVSRGQPSGGLVFCQDFRSGFSDHFGVKDGFGLMLLSFSKTCHAAPAVTVTAFSTYLIGLCILFSISWLGSRKRLRGDTACENTSDAEIKVIFSRCTSRGYF